MLGVRLGFGAGVEEGALAYRHLGRGLLLFRSRGWWRSRGGRPSLRLGGRNREHQTGGGKEQNSRKCARVHGTPRWLSKLSASRLIVLIRHNVSSSWLCESGS